MPDDLLNFAWHKSSETETNDWLLSQQVETQAAFCLPIAYVRVPASYQAGNSIDPSNVIDIRPFLRTTELSYSERAAIATSIDPHGNNPFITKSVLDTHIGVLQDTVNTLQTQVNSNTGRIDVNVADISAVTLKTNQLGVDVSGTGGTVTNTSLNHEGRIASLEAQLGQGTSIPVERTNFLNPQHTVFQNARCNTLGTAAAPKTWDITNAIPAADRENVVAVMFRVMSDGNTSDTDNVNWLGVMGGVQGWRTVSIWGVAQSNGDLRRNQGMVNCFHSDVTKITTGSSTSLTIQTKCTGSSDVDHSLYVEGYIALTYV